MDPFYIFGIHLNTILLISIILSIISFVVMIFTTDVGRIIFKISIGLLIFCIVFWLAIMLYYLFGFSDYHYESIIFYIILILLIALLTVIYISFNLGEAFFD